MAASKAASVGAMVAAGPESGESVRASTVFRPWPVTRATTRSSRRMAPEAPSLPRLAMVPPPAVSAKMPSVRASSPMASMTSPSVTAAHEPPVRRSTSRAYQPSAGLPMDSDLAMVLGLTGRMASVPSRKAVATGEHPSARGPRAPHGGLFGQEAALAQLGEALGHLGQLAARADGHDHVVGGLPAQLLGDFEGERLGALGVIGAHVDVDEGPARALAGQLGAEPVDVVVRPLDRDHGASIDRGHRHLGRLEVVRD